MVWLKSSYFGESTQSTLGSIVLLAMFSKWSLCLPKDTLHWLYQITLNMIWCKIIQIWNVDEHHVKFESLTILTNSQYLQIQTECLQYWSVLWLFLQSLSITKSSATLNSYWRYKKFFTGLFVCLFVCLFLRWYHKMLLSFSPLKLIQSASLFNSISAALAFCQVESKCLVYNLVCLWPGLFVRQDDQSGDFLFLAWFIIFFCIVYPCL